MVAEERFDKIRYYLRHSLYPQGADRSEKSRLRSAATHYKLVGGQNGVPEKLMLKGKEVISDPQQQYEIAKTIHCNTHGGINKTTARIATKYHWVRIKETASHVIKNCPECKDSKDSKDSSKGAVIRSETSGSARLKAEDESEPLQDDGGPEDLMAPDETSAHPAHDLTFDPTSQLIAATAPTPLQDHEHQLADYDEMAIDPQIMAQIVAAYPAHPDPYSHPGVPDYDDGTHHLHHHHVHSDDYDHEQPDHFMSDDNPAIVAHDHIIEANDPNGRLRSQLSQHLLHAAYIDGGPEPHYKQ